MAPRLHLGTVPPDAVVVLFEQRFWEPVARGEVTVTFRRWKRRQAITGNRYRTPKAIIEADAVDVITVDDITDADARAGGYRSSSALIADLRGSADLDLYRIRFHVVDEPDPRASSPATPPSPPTIVPTSTAGWTGSIVRAATDRGRARRCG